MLSQAAQRYIGSLLQSCIKVANEAPVDAKANLRMAYANFGEDKWSPCGMDMKKVNGMLTSAVITAK